MFFIWGVPQRRMTSPSKKHLSAGSKINHRPFYITNVGGEPRVKPGVWRPEMWALCCQRSLNTASFGAEEAQMT
jgi:hypothetical protein